jgi:hypothetical protein
MLRQGAFSVIARSLRNLPLPPLAGAAFADIRRTRARGGLLSFFFWSGVLALLLHFIFSFNTFAAMGFDVEAMIAPGGNPLLKFHPATYVILLTSPFLLARSKYDFARLCRTAPGLMLFIFGIPLLALYSIAGSGLSGSAVYIETFWSAGMLALLLEAGTDAQRRTLGRILLALCILNVLVGIYESLTYTELFPLDIVNDPQQSTMTSVDVTEFRGHGFFGHPLTAALMTAMAVVLLYATHMRVWAMAPLFALLMIGLLAFGGRAALGVTLLISGGTAVWLTIRSIFSRRIELDVGLALFCAALVIPLVVGYIVSETTIGDRIFNSLYFDDSAAVRSIQWRVFDYLTTEQWLFGVSAVDLQQLKYQIGLGGGFSDIENFWILMFLNLGAIGFIAFLAIFIAFLGHLISQSRQPAGWALVITMILIDSTSNSLGVRSIDLVFLTGFAIGMSGFRKSAQMPVLRRVRRRQSKPGRVAESPSARALALRPLR